jgi:6-phosphofructokinase 1
MLAAGEAELDADIVRSGTSQGWPCACAPFQLVAGQPPSPCPTNPSRAAGGKVETDAGGNRKLPPVGLWLQGRIAAYFKERGTTVHIKFIGASLEPPPRDSKDRLPAPRPTRIVCVPLLPPVPSPVPATGADPSYMIRSVPANPADAILCTLLAQSAVHGVMAGYTGLSVGACGVETPGDPGSPGCGKRPVSACAPLRAPLPSALARLTLHPPPLRPPGLVNNRSVYLPISAITDNSPRRLNPRGRTYERLLATTLQPDPLTDPEIAAQWRARAGAGPKKESS